MSGKSLTVNSINFCFGICLALCYWTFGALMFCTIVGKDYAMLLIKTGNYLCWPSPRRITQNNEDRTWVNWTYVCLFGFWWSIVPFIMGCIIICTVIGKDLAMDYFKLAKLSWTGRFYDISNNKPSSMA